MIVDEVHNISLTTRQGAEVSDTLKYFSEHIPATFIYAGIDIEHSSTLSGTRGAQIAGRLTLIPTRPFPYNDEWKGLVKTMEDTLLLHHHKPGTLAALDRYLHDRTGGMTGALSHQIRGAAIGAILTGTEKITQVELEAIPWTSPPAPRLPSPEEPPGEPTGARTGPSGRGTADPGLPPPL
ncbi:hypothetical protein ACFYUJ_37665 [Streptomyces sp. NPDC004520]|uniref:hypothetical protein n=1 Tax=Streptomyces sp. NPDC004520 TaxID=3364702 RepID=UPI0036753A98